MTILKCDTCGSENARKYQYDKGRSIAYIDLCVSCVQDWVLKHQKKLSEVSSGQQSSGKKVIFG